MHMLKQIIGKEALFDIMRHILAQYAGRALRTMDFWRICEEKSGVRLDWLFTDGLHSNRLAGYEIVSVESDGGGIAVTVSSFGDFKFPVCVEARLSDGSAMRKQLNRLMDTQTIFFDVNPENVRILLDTDRNLLLRTENTDQR
jgi:aminopeptidase N